MGSEGKGKNCSPVGKVAHLGILALYFVSGNGEAAFTFQLRLSVVAQEGQLSEQGLEPHMVVVVGDEPTFKESAVDKGEQQEVNLSLRKSSLLSDVVKLITLGCATEPVFDLADRRLSLGGHAAPAAHAQAPTQPICFPCRAAASAQP